MINLRNSPFLWLAFVLLLSTCVGDSLGIPQDFPLKILCAGLCIIASCLCILRYAPGRQYRSTLAILMMVFCAGMARIHDFKNVLYPGAPLEKAEYHTGIVIVSQVLKNKPGLLTLRCRTHTLSYQRDTTGFPYLDRFILLQVKTTSGLAFFPGDVLGVKGYVSPIRPPFNPEGFDAKKYYNTIGIRHSLQCREEHLQLQHRPQLSFMRMTARWQYFLSSIVKQHTDKQVAQLANALVWGDRSDMDGEIIEAFADTGAMHVLSVSGMHVAILYSMLMMMLGPPGAGNFSKRMTRFAIYALAILLYVGLAGACPAVVRAGLMILLFLFGKAMGWNTQIWNLLGFAGFVMIWLNPFIRDNIGFQLSFLAMAGILLFAQPVIRYYNFRNIVFQKTWEIVAVSIAAQVFIVPILLAQFHQFPVTFLASSVVATPAAYIVMGSALLNVLLSLMSIDFLWPALDYSGKIFIDAMQWMAEYNPLMFFSLPPLASWMLMLMAIGFTMALVFKIPLAKKTGYCCGLACFIVMAHHRTMQWSTDEIIIYHSYKGLLMDCFIGGECISVQSEKLSPKAVEFSTRGYRCKKDIRSVISSHLQYVFTGDHVTFSNNILTAKSKHILIYDDRYEPVMPSLPVEGIVLEKINDWKRFNELLCNFHNTLFILPAHLERWKKKKALQLLEEQSIPVYDMDTKGYCRIML